MIYLSDEFFFLPGLLSPQVQRGGMGAAMGNIVRRGHRKCDGSGSKDKALAAPAAARSGSPASQAAPPVPASPQVMTITSSMDKG